MLAACQIDGVAGPDAEFTDERDWAKFHDPKSLVLALVGELASS
jgi:hypothetical protein